jgi:hypothetical protein
MKLVLPLVLQINPALRTLGLVSKTYCTRSVKSSARRPAVEKSLGGGGVIRVKPEARVRSANPYSRWRYNKGVGCIIWVEIKVCTFVANITKVVV